MIADERCGRFRAEVDISLVDHDRRIGPLAHEPFDLRARQGDPRGGVRVGDDDGAAPAKIIVDTNAHLGVERDRLMVNAPQPAEDGIEAVGDVRKKHGFGLLKQPGEGVSEHLVRAVADKDLPRRDPVIFG